MAEVHITKLNDWNETVRRDTYGDRTVDAGTNITTNHLAVVEAIPHGGGGAEAHQGMAQVVVEDRISRGLDAFGRDRITPKPSTPDILRIVGARIARAPLDPNSARARDIRKQDMGWAGYEADTVVYKEKQSDGSTVSHEIPNHLRPVGFRQTWAARRMDYAYRRHKGYENRALQLRAHYDKRGVGATNERERLKGIQQREDLARRGIFEKYNLLKVDARLKIIDKRAEMKLNKFNRLASGKWWAI